MDKWTKKRLLYILLVIACLLTGCIGKERQRETVPSTEETIGQDTSDRPERDDFHEETESDAGEENSENHAAGDTQVESFQCETEMLDFVDVFQNPYQVEINPAVKKHSYRKDAFVHNGEKLTYKDTDLWDFRLGVDVSEHQGTIDWQRVRAAGYEFAFIRIGYRGYGETGRLCVDKEFHANIQAAQAAGIDVGVYFFSQAINETEALEEANLVLKNLQGYELQLPVVYDPEHILDDIARTDGVSGEQFTANTLVFCEKIRESGYQPMIYSNMLWEAYEFDLEQLANYPIWYADYEPQPQTPYHFDFWQYSNAGQVDGILGVTDLDIQMLAK